MGIKGERVSETLSLAETLSPQFDKSVFLSFMSEDMVNGLCTV